jgi:hypothetical protein
VRDKQVEALDEELASRGMAAHFEPEDAEGQGSIDRGLSFRGIDSQDGERGLTFAQKSPSIDRAERLFQVDGGR